MKIFNSHFFASQVMGKNKMYRHFGKRLFDIISSVCALAALGPVMLAIAILVRIKMGSPIVFCQQRPGLNSKIFKMYKFRTMTNKKDKDGNLLPDEKRLTKFGKMLRATSLDELPELFNILKGDMSVIGPRPLLVQYLSLYSAEQMRRHDVRPGLSGYAQVNGRNAITWQEKFKLDCWYVDNLSFRLDIKIIYTTIIEAFFKRGGINSETSATMEFFTGNENE